MLISQSTAEPETGVQNGLQKVYFEGLEYLRNKIREIEDDLVQIKLNYYHCEEEDEDKFVDYLKQCDSRLLAANSELRKHDKKLEVIDAEVRLVTLLNLIRDISVDQECVDALTEYWDSIKTATESCLSLVYKFQKSVLDRFKLNCTSYTETGIQLEVSVKYTEEISGYLNEVESLLTNTHMLIKSYNSGLHQDLFDTTAFSRRLLVSCDLRAFPLLRFIADVTDKIRRMCEIARQWLARDEKYVYEINNYIMETRSITRRAEEDLRTKKEKHKKFEKTVRAASILLANNKEKLQKIETDLNSLSDKMSGKGNEKKCKYEEKQQKESMVDFLKITLSQTKRNYNLQMKRSRLLKQVKSLEKVLWTIERDLTDIGQEITVKSQEKVLLEEKVGTNEKSYSGLKTDLDKFSDSLERLETEANGLSSQLLQLEIVYTLKTSPETVEEIYDRPSSVKLAPSLREKIKQRKRKTLMQVR